MELAIVVMAILILYTIRERLGSKPMTPERYWRAIDNGKDPWR